MKTKSHTGEMVEARVGMVVKTARFNNGIVKIVALGDDSTLKDCVQVEHPFGFTWVYASECTMLHCPLSAGDKLEVAFEIIGTDKAYHPDFDNFNGKLYRHADPNLRDSPDYKPEERV